MVGCCRASGRRSTTRSPPPLTAADAPSAQLAHHWHRAGAIEAALECSVAAGLEASRLYAFAEARRHFERALELGDPAVPLAVDTARPR